MTTTKKDLTALNADLKRASEGNLQVLESPGDGYILVMNSDGTIHQLCKPRALRDIVEFGRGWLAGRSHAQPIGRD